MEAQLLYELLFLIFLLIMVRITFLIHKITTNSNLVSSKRSKPCRAVICLGSGGHTTEMMNLIQNVNFHNYMPRYYIVANTDETSMEKVVNLETKKSFIQNKEYFIVKIPRSRSVGQSYFTSIFTTIISILYSFPVFLKTKPDVILCNGPGSCIPICIVSFLFKCLFFCDTRIIFVESFCRTKTFSLSGKILMYLADNFLVQWPNLKRKLKRAEYIGQLM